MNWSRSIALFSLATACALAQAPKAGSVFQGGLASSLLAADTPPASITEARGAEGWGDTTAFSSGSWLQIKGTNFTNVTFQQWLSQDFNGNTAPTTLGGVSVFVNGKNAFVNFISTGQVNVQAPDDPAVGPVPITIVNNGVVGNSVFATKVAVTPGLLAPPSTFPFSFFQNGKQYLEATLGAQNVYAGSPNLVSNFPYPFQVPKPGDSVWLYGIGFGDVDPATPAGQIAGVDKLVAPLTISFDQTPANVGYAGHYPGYVGLYLLVVTVPNVPPGDHQIIINLNNQPVPQKVYLTTGQ